MSDGNGAGTPKQRDIFAVERRETIRRLVSERGRVRTSELAQLLDVTDVTIRKDITELENQGLLVRAHGGAVARGPMAEVAVTERENRNLAEKRAIARACCDLLRPGDSVFLDGGTTQHEIARVLAGDGQARQQPTIKILTNSFTIAEICQAIQPDPPVVLGGRYRPHSGVFVGPITISTLQQFRVDIAFIGVTGITEHGFCVADVSEAAIKREAIQRAQRTVVAMDHSKVGLSDFINICPISAVDTVVTDRDDDVLAGWLGQAAVEMIVAGPST